MDSTADRFRKVDNSMPPGAFRNFIKEFNHTSINGVNYHFKFKVIKEYQRRAFDDGNRFEGDGYTIYVIDAPYREWCLAHNRDYEFHYYGSPVGKESICWNHLIETFEHANRIMILWVKNYCRIVDSLIANKSINSEKYVSKQRQKYNVPAGTFRNKKMLFTQEVYDAIRETIGKLKPEQGGFLGISNEQDIVDTYVHDTNAKVAYSEYNPNVAFINNVINGDWYENNIDFCGFIHSHPNSSNRLSDADIEYAIRIMEEFDLAYLYMPLVNSSADGKFNLYGFYVHRNGFVERCNIEIVEVKTFEEELNYEDDDILSDEEIMNYFSSPSPKPVSYYDDNQFTRIESCLPLDYLKSCTVIGIGCGGAREFYIDMARMGIKQFFLMDGDTVSITNISSQNVYLNELNRFKTDVIKEKIELIDESIDVHSITKMLDYTLDDKWFEDEILSKVDISKTIICAFTDNFYAQSRISNLSVKYRIPFISAQHHQFGLTSEVVYWYPDVSIATSKSILKERYRAYKNGYKNNVTSEGSPIFNTVRLNAICEKLAIGILLYNYNHNNSYSSFLINRKQSNLIVIKQTVLSDTQSTLISLFSNEDECFFDEPCWVKVDAEEEYDVIDSRIIF
jgi:molybdopterin/thiamine biosynthesis adenylyltransferase/proteasome lid subunit RPN8/RPN11